jgi:hypothetical protein
MVIVLGHRVAFARFPSAVTLVRVNGIHTRMVLMLVVTKMGRWALRAFMHAIRLHRSPDGLQRQQEQQENGDQSAHGWQYIDRSNKS